MCAVAGSDCDIICGKYLSAGRPSRTKKKQNDSYRKSQNPDGHKKHRATSLLRLLQLKMSCSHRHGFQNMTWKEAVAKLGWLCAPSLVFEFTQLKMPDRPAEIPSSAGKMQARHAHTDQSSKAWPCHHHQFALLRSAELHSVPRPTYGAAHEQRMTRHQPQIENQSTRQQLQPVGPHTHPQHSARLWPRMCTWRLVLSTWQACMQKVHAQARPKPSPGILCG